MRLTRFGKLLIVAVLCAAVVSVVAPSVGLVMCIVLAVIGLFALAEGVMSSSSQVGHEAWAQVEADRKREALRRAGR